MPFSSPPAAVQSTLPSAATIKIPSLRSRSPDFAALTDQRADLAAKRQALLSELHELRRNMKPYDPTPPEDPATIRANELLGRIPQPARVGDVEKLVALQTEIRDLTAAIEILDHDVVVARNRISATIRAEVRPEYRHRAGEFYRALGAAFQAAWAVEEVADAMQAEDVALAGEQLHLPRFVRSTRNPYSDIVIALREAAKDGLIAAGDLPKGMPQI